MWLVCHDLRMIVEAAAYRVEKRHWACRDDKELMERKEREGGNARLDEDEGECGCFTN